MAYSDWSRNSTAPNASFNPSGFPVDFRTLRDTLSEVFSVGSGYRFPGLKTYVVDNGIEYMFTASVSAATGKITFPNNRIQEYHPELAHFKSIDSSNLPNDLPTGINDVADILAHPASVLGDGAFTYNGTTYYTIPDGTAGIIKVLDNGSYSYYNYIWNGATNAWVQIVNSGSGSGIQVLRFDFEDEITNGSINARYSGSPTSGTEVIVVYNASDGNEQTTREYSRKYIYLNQGWNILQGVKEYTIEFPEWNGDSEEAYNGWNSGPLEMNTGLMDLLDLDSDITLFKDSSDNTVYAIISHRFNYQYIDAFMFEYSEEDVPGSADSSVDMTGDRLLSSVVCYKDGSNSSAFKVKIGPIPIPSESYPAAKKYVITLQK